MAGEVTNTIEDALRELRRQLELYIASRNRSFRAEVVRKRLGIWP